MSRQLPVSSVLRGLFLWGSFVFCLGSMAWSACYYTVGAGRPQPALVCECPLVDLGTVLPTDVKPCTFVIHNQGTRPLIVSRVSTGCGACVRVTDFPRTPILPAGQGVIAVELLGQSVTGPQVKGVRVDSNDPRHPSLTLRLAARPAADRPPRSAKPPG